MSASPGWSALMARYSVRDDSEPGRQLRLYCELLQRWGARVNLTASTEWAALAPLFEEALWAARHFPDAPIRQVDFGSGGGFPLIPIKILNPSLQVTLIESRERKAFFLEHLARELGLRDLTVECCRVRDYLERAVRRPGWQRASWKAVRIAQADWTSLLRQAAPGAELWIFHGQRLPVGGESRFLEAVQQAARHQIPNRTGAWLSIFKLLPSEPGAGTRT